MFNCLLFLAQLSQDISEVNLGFLVVRSQFKCFSAVFDPFLELVHLHVHDCDVTVSIDVGVERIQVL